MVIEKTAKLGVRYHRPNSPRRPKSPHTVRNHRPISPHIVRNHRPESPHTVRNHQVRNGPGQKLPAVQPATPLSIRHTEQCVHCGSFVQVPEMLSNIGVPSNISQKHATLARSWLNIGNVENVGNTLH